MKVDKIIFVALIAGSLISSCGSEPSDLDLDPGHDFFPLAVGLYKTYQVTEIHITGSVPDTAGYFLKEVISDSLVAVDGSVTYLISRFVREDLSSGAWVPDSVWTSRRNDRQAVVTENNVPFVKLTFPVRVGNSWNGNALNTQAAQQYYYAPTGVVLVHGPPTTPENSIRVVIADIPENLVNQDERSEVFVRGIGLVQKDYISVNFCQPSSGCETDGGIDNGRILSQVLIEYGEE